MDGDILKIILSLMILIVPVVGRVLKKAGELPADRPAPSSDSDVLAPAVDRTSEKPVPRRAPVSSPDPQGPENLKNETAGGTSVKHTGRKFIDDPKKLVIYSEIMRPKFKD